MFAERCPPTSAMAFFDAYVLSEKEEMMWVLAADWGSETTLLMVISDDWGGGRGGVV